MRSTVRRATFIVATVLVLTSVAGTVAADDHDNGCTPDGLDAGDNAGDAARIPEIPLDCRGRTNIEHDHEDWYVVSLDDIDEHWDGEETPFSVEVCPAIELVEPWDPDVHVYAGNAVPTFLGGFAPTVLTEIGNSTGTDGCNVVEDSHDFTGRQLFVQVNRTSGSGYYDFDFDLG